MKAIYEITRNHTKYIETTWEPAGNYKVVDICENHSLTNSTVVTQKMTWRNSQEEAETIAQEWLEERTGEEP